MSSVVAECIVGSRIHSVTFGVKFVGRFVKKGFLFLVLFAAFGSALASTVPDGIEVRIEPLRSDYSAKDLLRVNVTYTNNTDQDINFLTWGSALEKTMTHDFLKITFDGVPVSYVGIHAKRLPPTNAAYQVIPAKGSVSGEVDLGSSYAITLKGEYILEYEGLESSEGGLGFKSLSSVVLNVSENRLPSAARREPIIQPSCNATQRAQIDQALTIAERIANVAARDLAAAPIDQRPNARRYTEWFGAYTAGRYDNVSRGMSRIASALSNNRIGFDCACNISNRENTFAFVFKNDPFNMNVCPVFFRVTPSGTDSRSGTIVHEISHFSVVANSDDFSSALDQRGSRNLALSNPNNAIRNANAFEYFAENTPFLEMPAPSGGGGQPENPSPPEPVPEPEPETPIIVPILPILLDE